MAEDASIANNVTPIRRRMTTEQYDAERAKLRAAYGDSSGEANARREQTLALLFYHSDWTQEELAQKEGLGRHMIGRSLTFGRFLNYVTTVSFPESIQKNLSERRFRAAWFQSDKTETNERIRFRRTLEILTATSNLPKPPPRAQIAQPIKEQFADGKWHRLATIIEKLGLDPTHTEATLDAMTGKSAYGCKTEKKKVGTHYEFRIFKEDKTVGLHELTEKLAPILEGLKREGSKNMVTMVPAVVLKLAIQLERILEDLAE